MERRQLAVAAIAGAAVLGIGGGIAVAQSDNGSSTTVTTPNSSENGSTATTPQAQSAPSQSGNMAGGCDHRGARGGQAPSSGSTTAPSSGTANAETT